MEKTILSITCQVIQQYNGFQIQFPVPAKTKKVYLKAFYNDKNELDIVTQPPKIVITPANSTQELFSFNLFTLEKCTISPLDNTSMSLQVFEGTPQKRYFLLSKGIKENLQLFKQEIVKIFRLKKENQQQKLQGKQSNNNNKSSQIQVQSKAVQRGGYNIQQQKQSLQQQQNIQNRRIQVNNRSRANLEYQQQSQAKKLLLKQRVLKLSQQDILPKGFIDKVPDNILVQILKFLDKKQLYSMRLVSQEFNNLTFYVIEVLDFNKAGDIPKEMVINLLNRSKFVKKITFGQFKHISQTNFLDDIITSHKNLQIADFSSFYHLTNKIVKRFFEKSPQLKQLILPYFSKMSDEPLQSLAFYLKNIESIQIKAFKQNFNKNPNISDIQVAKLIEKNEKLKNLKVFTTQHVFFQKLQQYTIDNNKNCLNIIELKITNILLKEQKNVDFLNSIEGLKNLQVLKLKNVMIKDGQGFDVIFKIPNDVLRRIFKSCQQLHSITFGNWADNIALQLIAQFVSSRLKKLYVSGNTVDDIGIKDIVEFCDNLEILKLKDCTQIGGEGFYNIKSQNIKMVSLTLMEYNANVLKDIISGQGQDIDKFKIKVNKL